MLYIQILGVRINKLTNKPPLSCSNSDRHILILWGQIKTGTRCIYILCLFPLSLAFNPSRVQDGMWTVFSMLFFVINPCSSSWFSACHLTALKSTLLREPLAYTWQLSYHFYVQNFQSTICTFLVLSFLLVCTALCRHGFAYIITTTGLLQVLHLGTIYKCFWIKCWYWLGDLLYER